MVQFSRLLSNPFRLYHNHYLLFNLKPAACGVLIARQQRIKTQYSDLKLFPRVNLKVYSLWTRNDIRMESGKTLVKIHDPRSGRSCVFRPSELPSLGVHERLIGGCKILLQQYRHK